MDDHDLPHPHHRPPRQRLAQLLRRWGSVIAAALVLLALSQSLWWWQTWPLRQLLDAPAPAGVRR